MTCPCIVNILNSSPEVGLLLTCTWMSVIWCSLKLGQPYLSTIKFPIKPLLVIAVGIWSDLVVHIYPTFQLVSGPSRKPLKWILCHLMGIFFTHIVHIFWFKWFRGSYSKHGLCYTRTIVRWRLSLSSICYNAKNTGKKSMTTNFSGSLWYIILFFVI